MGSQGTWCLGLPMPLGVLCGFGQVVLPLWTSGSLEVKLGDGILACEGEGGRKGEMLTQRALGKRDG